MKNSTKSLIIAVLQLLFQIIRFIVVIVGLYLIIFHKQELSLLQTETKQTSPQTEANKRWQEKNREKAKYLRNRSTARSFIKNQATAEDIKELQQLIQIRIEFLASASEQTQ